MRAPESLVRFSDEQEALLLRFEDAWNSGEPVDLRAYCPPTPDLAFVKELVRIDVARRKSRNLSVDASRYLSNFPELQDSAESIRKLAEETLIEAPRVSPAEPGQPSIPGFELIRELGRGGMGVVYLARQTSINREVALKMVLTGAIASEEELTRFRGEAAAVAGLSHRHIVQLYEFGTHEGLPYFTLEYVPGGSLADRVKEAPLSAAEAATLIEGLALGVAAAHARNIIHRDLKPGNVLMAADGTPKIADFGLAKRTDAAQPEKSDESLTRTGAIVGTPQYMSPEQARGEKTIGPATDIWALGAILYRVLTGRPPFLGATALETIQQVTDAEPIAPRNLIRTIPHDLETICLKCLQKDPTRRYASAKELADDLRRYLDGKPIVARPVSAVERGIKWAKRRPAAATALGLLVALVIGLGIGLWAVNRERGKTAKERDQKDIALETEIRARNLTMNTLRKLTDEVVEKQMSRRVGGLTDDDKRFLREILAQYEEFAALSGESVEQRTIRAEGQYRVATISNALGQFTAAESGFKKAIEQYGELVSEFPDHNGFRTSQARAKHNLGLLYRTTGRIQLAETMLLDALSEKRHLAAKSADDTEAQFDLASTFGNLGIMYFELGRLEESEKSFLTAIEIQQRAMPGSANRPEFRQQLALNYYNLTDILSTLGKSKEAESACAKALALKKELTEQFPARHEFQRDLAGSYHMGAMLHMSNGRLEPALSPCREAATIRKKLVAEFPVHFEMRQELGLSLNLLGLVLGKSGKPKEADDAYEECAAVQKKLVTDFPDVPDAHHDLAGTYVNRASLARNRKDYEQARKWLEEAQPFHLSALTSKPDHPGYRQYYLNNQTLLVLVNAEAGDPAAAIAAADQIPKLGWLPAANAYHAAMLMVACADMAGQNSKLNEADRKIQSQQYADQAMALLKLAVANGFSDATRLKSDPALKSIRAREDFGALLKQLQSK